MPSVPVTQELKQASVVGTALDRVLPETPDTTGILFPFQDLQSHYILHS